MPKPYFQRFRSVCLPAAIFFAALAALFLLQRLLVPKYQESLMEGALIREYYAEAGGHDMIFFGDCEVYECFSPAVLAEETGLRAFIRGSASQRIWQSYYLMEETLSYETPDYFVFNVLAMKYEEPPREEYNRMSLDGMRLSAHKLRAIRASAGPEESLLSYLFPLLRYHDRWRQLTGEDFRYFFRGQPVSEHGYLAQYNVEPAGAVPEGKPLADYRLPERCYGYLDRMAALCEENGITLILVKAPVLYPYWYPEWDTQIAGYAKEHGLSYINFLDHVEEIGLDYNTDTADGGAHLNDVGARKLTSYFSSLYLDGLLSP